MSRTLRYAWAVLSLIILGAGIQTGSAFAHEHRSFAGPSGPGHYILFVGFRNEPAFEDEGNAMDLFLIRDIDGDGKCTQDTPEACLDWLPVSKRDGDVVDVQAQVLYLNEESSTRRSESRQCSRVSWVRIFQMTPATTFPSSPMSAAPTDSF